jgi:hypothetical protein
MCVNIVHFLLRGATSFPLELFLLHAKIYVVEILSAIVFFKWLFVAFLNEMRRR